MLLQDTAMQIQNSTRMKIAVREASLNEAIRQRVLQAAAKLSAAQQTLRCSHAFVTHIQWASQCSLPERKITRWVVLWHVLRPWQNSRRSLSADMEFLGGGTDQPFDQIQDTDLLLADFLSLPNDPREAEARSSTRLNAFDSNPRVTGRKPAPARVMSNRKAQQRFRQKQKAKKAADSSELLHLRQRVQELERLVTRRPDSDCTLAQAQTATVEVCCTGFTSTFSLQPCMIGCPTSLCTTQDIFSSNDRLLEAVGVLRLEKTLLQVSKNNECSIVLKLVDL